MRSEVWKSGNVLDGTNPAILNMRLCVDFRVQLMGTVAIHVFYEFPGPPGLTKSDFHLICAGRDDFLRSFNQEPRSLNATQNAE